MKRFILNSIFLLLFSCNIIAHENNFESQSKSLYIAYFWIKECITFFSYHHFFINHDITDNVYVVCKNCQYPISFYHTFGSFTAKGEEEIITQLKRLAYYETGDELAQFLENIHNNHQIVCHGCDSQYHGWIKRISKPKHEVK